MSEIKNIFCDRMGCRKIVGYMGYNGRIRWCDGATQTGRWTACSEKHLKECKKFSKNHKQKLSLAKIGKIPASYYKLGFHPYGNAVRGWFDINGKKMFFRSKWEVNYALYLDFLVKQNQIKKWEYESEVFIFEKIKFGTRSYRPDFKIFNNNGSIEYHEVKGWMDKKSITKIKRMKIYYPQVKLIVIDKICYMEIVKSVGKLLNFI